MDSGEPNKDMQSPNTGMPAPPHTSHTPAPPNPPAESTLSSTVVPPTDDPEKEITIAVMGVTGTGKSYFIREVSGISDIEVSGSLHSCTTQVQSYSFPYAGIKITLVDTPGFNDSAKGDTEVLTDICAWMSSSYREGQSLSGVIYLHRITDVRMDGSSLKNLRMFQRLCGTDALQNVLLTTTQWSNVNPALGESREKELRDGDFWGGLMDEGASVERFSGTRESGLDLVNKLMGKEPKPLLIQDQMVDKDMTLVETDVGKFMNEELISLQKKYEKSVEHLERQRQSAIKERDDEMEAILAQEQEKTQERAEEAAAERKFLEDLHAAEMRKREAENKRREESKNNDGVVIAVDVNDIGYFAHISSLAIPYSTKGRLINDIDSTSEFEKDPIDIKINYELNISLIPTILAKTISQFVGDGVDHRNYIIHNNSSYWSHPGGSIQKGTQKFHISTKF